MVMPGSGTAKLIGNCTDGVFLAIICRSRRDVRESLLSPSTIQFWEYGRPGRRGAGGLLPQAAEDLLPRNPADQRNRCTLSYQNN